MKGKLATVAASLILGTSLLGVAAPAFAATNVTPASNFKFSESTITLNGKTVVAKAARFVSNGTSFVSLYDADLLMKALGAQVSWNGSKGVLNVADSGVLAHLEKSPGSVVFEINGKPVIHSNIIVAKPRGDKQATTFVGIWWVQQIVNQVIAGGSDKWNGGVSPATWRVSTTKQATSNNWIGTTTIYTKGIAPDQSTVTPPGGGSGW